MGWGTAARVGFILIKNKKTRRLLLALAVVLLMLGFLMIVAGGAMIASVVSMCQEQAEEVSSSTSTPSSSPSQEATSDIPDDLLPMYEKYAEQYGVDWALVAAVGKQESNHGQDYSGCATSEDGAQGIMQFIPSTWASEGVDGNGDGTKDPCNEEDAIASGASYLANLGAGEDERGALCSYYGMCADGNANYADEVMAQAEAYRGSEEGGGSEGSGSGSEDSGSATGLIPPLMSKAYAYGVSDTPAGWSLVEDDKTMTYYSESRYDSYIEAAVEEWNALGGVDIQPAESAEEANLVFRDVPNSQWQYSWAMGYTKTTDPAATKGEIVIKAEEAESASETVRKSLMVHEMGHALGFNHQNGKESVMSQDLQTDVPTEMDVEIYKETWGGEGSPANANPEDSYGEEQTSEQCSGLGPLSSLARIVPGV